MATGRKTVVVGQVIDPVAWGNPLWDQSVQQFASAADRTAQFPAPLKGATTWLDDVKRLEVYNGTAWVPIQAGDTGWLLANAANGFTFQAGWTAAAPVGGFQTLSFRVIGSLVYINGAVQKSTAWVVNESTVLVPATLRPTSAHGGNYDVLQDITATGFIRPKAAGGPGTLGIDIHYPIPIGQYATTQPA